MNTKVTEQNFAESKDMNSTNAITDTVLKLLSPESIYAVAQYVAVLAHKNQKDKAGMPYYLHLYRVAENVAENKTVSFFHKTVAMLHDILEDTDVTEEQLRMLFPPFVCDAVVALTRKENESYKDYIERVNKNNLARTVKIADLTDNMDFSRLNEISDEDLARLKKYAKWRQFLIKESTKEQ